jgi:membrane protein
VHWRSRYGALPRSSAQLIRALNVAYDVHDQRSFIKRALVALILTTGAIVGGVLVIAALVVLPTVLGMVRLDPALQGLLTYARWPVVAALVWLGLLIIYRIGPNRRQARWAWSNPGAAVAALIWLAGSAALSWYVENLGNFNGTYGSMGAVVVLLFWFLMSGYAVLFGAELNAELEQGPKRGSG